MVIHPTNIYWATTRSQVQYESPGYEIKCDIQHAFAVLTTDKDPVVLQSELRARMEGSHISREGMQHSKGHKLWRHTDPAAYVFALPQPGDTGQGLH